MKTALEIVAFSHGCEFSGTLALLETARRVLDRKGDLLAAAYVDMAINAFVIRADEDAAQDFSGISQHQ